MSKYGPLGNYLRDQRKSELRLRFGDIEKIIGAKLPPAAHTHRAWWSNNPSNNVMTKIWLDAGFETAQVDLSTAELTFRRRAQGPSTTPPAAPRRQSFSGDVKAHPLRGLLKAMTNTVPGVDLTQPADPDWGPATERRYGR